MKRAAALRSSVPVLAAQRQAVTAVRAVNETQAANAAQAAEAAEAVEAIKAAGAVKPTSGSNKQQYNKQK
ncbi:hypothetical protein EN871_25165 [bacterium M00.F.Ca.ET.228.01.1.1]|uniref:hypothetical protein n=1 Tax=Paraburkholderia phenoliruptrix TaxID=252970 RepID=UPI00109301C5|nr:hypothetical protein [Paraburkholderia phenoliruptrix]TGP41027.1 hypothetical protein EN871_25165 [bacterium M00.F.Ca.ET.228.01.1.1]TGR97525.1 hypothetical protein EN834_25140 [bacterium M00.F.Ca.ET.191.01.1.1]TGU09156.1 hypothetical protein EN798_08595 [bacterium M00.F.Ca.ET.155.01.1.1]MBW0450599.1 hypothetical protein [Paraburkholderia phenoliruptrix]MBW9101889.1 hypothetical protein [Paraburkholderia phenoliruptrix]